MNIFIVRHAETELNNQGIIQGSDIDTEINKNVMLQSNKFFYLLALIQHIKFH